VVFSSFDGTYTETLSMEQATRDDVLVAHTMAGKPLSRDHGGPVRLYVAPMYGYKSLKWLERIEVTDHLPDWGSYWEHSGYDIEAWTGRVNPRDPGRQVQRRPEARDSTLRWISARAIGDGLAHALERALLRRMADGCDVRPRLGVPRVDGARRRPHRPSGPRTRAAERD